MLGDLEKAPNGSLVMLHVCAHNPTGCDLTPAEWDKVLDLCKKKSFVPFMDMAYQGFTSGDVDKDAYALRLFADSGLPIVLA